MKKEVLIAIIIGFALGLIITFGIWSANKALKEAARQKEAPSKTAEEILPSPTPSSQQFLIITSPEDNFLSNQEKIEISGKTSPGASVVVLYQEGEKILEADEGGNFSLEISLAGGSNEITIKSYNTQGDEVEKILTGAYSTAEI